MSLVSILKSCLLNNIEVGSYTTYKEPELEHEACFTGFQNLELGEQPVVYQKSPLILCLTSVETELTEVNHELSRSDDHTYALKKSQSMRTV